MFDENIFRARTRREAIATNILGQYAKEELSTDLIKSTFITVSTDASKRKSIQLMSILVRFFIP
jgi:hypothetical protein